MVVKIAFSTALLASSLLLYNLLRFDILLLMASVLVICSFTYLIYKSDSNELIKMEHELGDSTKDMISIWDKILFVSIAITSLCLFVIMLVFVYLLFIH